MTAEQIHPITWQPKKKIQTSQFVFPNPFLLQPLDVAGSTKNIPISYPKCCICSRIAKRSSCNKILSSIVGRNSNNNLFFIHRQQYPPLHNHICEKTHFLLDRFVIPVIRIRGLYCLTIINVKLSIRILSIWIIEINEWFFVQLVYEFDFIL